MVANSFPHAPPLQVHYPYRYLLLADREVAMDAITINSLLEVGMLILFVLPVIAMFVIAGLEMFQSS